MPSDIYIDALTSMQDTNRVVVDKNTDQVTFYKQAPFN